MPNLSINNPLSNTINKFIESDNLKAMKQLIELKEKFNVIYIDPPYNTGNKFQYNDTFSDWSKFMKDRLSMANQLLTDDGMIFISIDKNEVFTLKPLCDDVFGKDNFITNLVWVSNKAGRALDKYYSETYEYILVYAKDEKQFTLAKKEVIDLDSLKPYKYEDEISKYKKGNYLYNHDSKFNINTRNELAYTIYYDKRDGSVRCINETIKQEDGTFIMPNIEFTDENILRITPPFRSTIQNYGCWRWQISTFMDRYKTELIWDNVESGSIILKDRLRKDGIKETKFKNIIEDIPTVKGTKELTDILGGKYFDSPKPTELIMELLTMHPNKNAKVLDFFAGSGTTGHAVLKQNNKDGGARTFVLCTKNELTTEVIEKFCIAKGYVGEKPKGSTISKQYKLWKEVFESTIKIPHISAEIEEHLAEEGIARKVLLKRFNAINDGYKTLNGKDVSPMPLNLEYYKI